MSFANPERTILEGDTVLIYNSINNMHAIEVRKEITNKLSQSVSERKLL